MALPSSSPASPHTSPEHADLETDVAVVHWPEQASLLERLRARGLPRLLLVAPDDEPPACADVTEDWLRLPARDADIRARLRTLATRAAQHAVPHVDDSALLHYRGQRLILSPTDHRLVAALVGRFGEVVDHQALGSAGWPGGDASNTALRLHILRLRRRLAPLGLTIRTVAGRGYLLEAQGPSGPIERKGLSDSRQIDVQDA